MLLAHYKNGFQGTPRGGKHHVSRCTCMQVILGPTKHVNNSYSVTIVFYMTKIHIIEVYVHWQIPRFIFIRHSLPIITVKVNLFFPIL